MTIELLSAPDAGAIEAEPRPATDVRDPLAPPLPLPVVRWLETGWPDGPQVVDTIAFSGRASVRRGALRLPVRFRMSHRLGFDHVADIRIGMGPMTLVRGLDAYVDWFGVSKVGRTAEVGPEVDQAGFLFLWSEAFWFPNAWARLGGLHWEPRDDAHAALLLPFRGGEEVASVEFDPESGMPSSFEASRHKGTGPRVRWRVEFGGWGWEDGLALPRRGTVRWLDEPDPWFVWRIDETEPEATVEDAITRGRLALVAGRAQAAERASAKR